MKLPTLVLIGCAIAVIGVFAFLLITDVEVQPEDVTRTIDIPALKS